MSEINFSKLAEPFAVEDIEWRLQSCGKTGSKFWGKCLAYITNRAIQQRLDEVVGPENWKNEYATGPNGGILCGLSIKCNGEWITKWDGAENTQVEAVKGGLSDSMKRAAVQWSMGRYLYKLDEGWAETSSEDRPSASYPFMGSTKDKERFTWRPPKLPSWALPKGSVNSEPKTELSPEAKAERDKEMSNNPEFLQVKKDVEPFLKGTLLNQEQKDKVNTAINEYNVKYLKSIVAWCKSESQKASA